MKALLFVIGAILVIFGPSLADYFFDFRHRGGS